MIVEVVGIPNVCAVYDITGLIERTNSHMVLVTVIERTNSHMVLVTVKREL